MPWRSSKGDTGAAQYYVPTRQLLKSIHVADFANGRVLPSKAGPTFIVSHKDRFRFVLELVFAVLDNELPVESFPNAVRAGITDGVSSMLCHVFWVVWADVEGPFRNAFLEDLKSEAASAPLDEPVAVLLADLVKICHENELVKTEDMYTKLDLRLLTQLGLGVASRGRPSFGSKMSTTRMAKVMRVQNYSAFREEPEGFAKLITLLYHPQLATHADPKKVEREVICLTGYFKLSPLKVVYCILVALESKPETAPVLLSLAPVRNKEWCHTVVSLRIRYGPRVKALGAGFFNMVASLLAEGIIDLAYTLAMMLAPQRAGNAPLKDSFNSATFEAAVAEARKTEPTRMVPSAESFNLDLSKRDAFLAAQIGTPPAIALLLAVFRQCSHELAVKMLRVLQLHSNGSVLAHRLVGLAAMARLHEMLLPYHESLFPAPGGALGACVLDRPNPPKAKPLSPQCIEFIQEIKSFAFRRCDTLSMLWRVLTHILMTHAASSDAHAAALNAVTYCAFPSTCLLAPNPAVWTLAQRCLWQLAQVGRCGVYNAAAILSHVEPVDRAHKRPKGPMRERLVLQHSESVDQILRNLQKKIPAGATDKREFQRTMGMITKVILAHPPAAAATLIHLARCFDNVGDLFVTLTGNLPLVVLEIIMFEGVRQLLCETRRREGDDGFNPADWHSLLLAFLGKFVARYEELDPRLLFRFVQQRVINEAGLLDVCLLEAVFRYSVGEQVTEIGPDHRQSLFLGPTCRSHRMKVAHFFSRGTTSKRHRRFLSSMCKQPGEGGHAILISLYVILCQLQLKLFNGEVEGRQDTRSVFDLVNRTHTVVLRFLRMLDDFPLDQLLPMLPSITDLCVKHQLAENSAPTPVLGLYRRALRSAINDWPVADAPPPAAEPKDRKGSSESRTAREQQRGDPERSRVSDKSKGTDKGRSSSDKGRASAKDDRDTRDKETDKGRERDREKSRDREKDGDRDRGKDRERDTDKARAKDRDREHERERDKDRDRDKEKDKGREKDRTREKDSSTARAADRSGPEAGAGEREATAQAGSKGKGDAAAALGRGGGGADGRAPMEVECVDADKGSGSDGPFSLRSLEAQVVQAIPCLGLKDSGIDARFYLLFWALELPDIITKQDMTQRYADFNKALLKELQDAKLNYTQKVRGKAESDQEARRQERLALRGAMMNAPGTTMNEIPIVTAADVEAADQVRVELEEKLSLLELEQKEYVARASMWHEFITTRMHQFFQPDASGLIRDRFVQHFVIPRTLWSMEDAMFTAHFIFKLVDLNVPGFPYVLIMEKIFNEMLCLLECCTDQEATNLSVFVKYALSLCNQTMSEEWFHSHKLFTRGSDKKGGAGDRNIMKVDAWKRFPAKYQMRIATYLASIIERDSGATVVLRNALKMISTLSPEFPTSKEAYQIISAALVASMERSGHRPDIEMLFTAAKRQMDNTVFGRKAQEIKDAEDGEVPDSEAHLEELHKRPRAGDDHGMRPAVRMRDEHYGVDVDMGRGGAPLTRFG